MLNAVKVAEDLYPILRFFTGLASAALMACELIVINAMIIASTPAKTKTHQWILTR